MDSASLDVSILSVLSLAFLRNTFWFSIAAAPFLLDSLLSALWNVLVSESNLYAYFYTLLFLIQCANAL